MDPTLSTKYAKTVQQLQKKKEELEQVFEEARSLESENAHLSAQNRELKSRNLELESATKSMSYEFAALEAQVRKQQIRLQHYIDQEAQSASGPASKPRPQDAQRISQLVTEAAEWKKKALHEEKEKSQLIEERIRLTATKEQNEKTIGELSEETRTLKSRLEQLEQDFETAKQNEKELVKQVDMLTAQRDGFAKDAVAYGNIESSALDGVREEILSLTNDNHRLVDIVEEERARLRELRSEYERFDDISRKQRHLADAQLRISREEIGALNTQNESLMAELKRMTIDKEQLRKKVNELQQQAQLAVPTQQQQLGMQSPPPSSQQHVALATPVKREVEVSSRGTMTVEVYQPASSATMQQSNELLEQQRLQLAQENANLHQKLSESHKALERAEHHNASLSHDCESLKGLLHQKNESQRLLEEKESLQQSELERLRQIAQATPLERLVRSPSHGIGVPKASLIHELEEVETFASKVLLLGTRTFDLSEDLQRSLADSATEALMSQSGSDIEELTLHHRGRGSPLRERRGKSEEGTVVPIVPCSRYSEPGVNRIMEQLGGLRHLLKKIHRTLKLQTSRQEGSTNTKKGKHNMSHHGRESDGFPAEHRNPSAAGWEDFREAVEKKMYGRLPSESEQSVNRMNATDESLLLASTSADIKPKFDLEAWLAEKKRARGEYTPTHSRRAGEGPFGMPQLHHDQNKESEYTKGTSLLEVVQELRRSPMGR